MKTLLARVASVTATSATGSAWAQSGSMMNGGHWGGGWMGGGAWVPVLLVVIVGLVAWIVMQRRK